MEKCPSCGDRLWPTVAHQQIQEEMPAFATVRWSCRQCGWTDEPDAAPAPGEGAGG